MKKNVASQSIGVQMITAADGTAFTGAVSVLVTLDNGTQTAGGGTAPAHEGNGYHSYTPTQAETNGDHIAYTFTGTGAIPATVQVYTTFPQTADAPTSAAIADAVWDESLAAHQTAVSAGRALTLGGVPIAETTVTGTPSTTSIQLTAGSTIDNYYNNQTLVIASGSGAGQARVILDYTGATRTCTFDEAFVTAPAAADAVFIRANHVHPLSEIQAGLALESTAQSILTDTAEIGTAGAGLTALATQASVNTIDDFLDTEIAAIKAKTDQMVFTKANELDINLQSVNGVTVNGDGAATPMGV